MEIIESFQAFENLADRTFRGRSLGYQDEYEPEVDVAERSDAWRMRRNRSVVRRSRSAEPCRRWSDRYRIGESRLTDVMGQKRP